MRANSIRKKGIILCSLMMITASVMTVNPAYADTVNEEALISDVSVPENGVIQYDVTVPAGSTVNYEVELTPEGKTGAIDSVSGMWKNTTKKAVKKTITAKVKFLSSEYTISATYTSNETQQKLEFKDQDTAVKSYEESNLHSRLSWDTGSAYKWKGILEKQLKRVSDLIH